MVSRNVLLDENGHQSAGAVASGGVANLLFEWNKTDLSQFDASGASPNFADGGGGGALSVVATAEHGNVIRYTGGGGTGITEVFLVSQTEIVLPDSVKRNVIVEMELFTSSFGTSGGAGPALLCDDGAVNFHGFVISHFAGAAGVIAKTINNGTVETGGSGGGSTPSKFGILHVYARKPASAPPEVSVYCDGWDGGTINSHHMFRTGSSSANRGVAGDIGSNSTLGATWDPLDCDRFGIAAHSNAGTGPPSFDVLDLRVIAI